MHDALSVNLHVTSDDLFEIINGLGLRHALLLDELAEVTILAELRDDVGVVLGSMNVEELDDVVTATDSLQTFNLGLKQHLMDVIVDACHIDGLDGYRAVYG